MKQCSGCNEWKDESEFYKNKSNRDGLTYKCANCMREATKKWASTPIGKKIKHAYNNSEKAKVIKRNWAQTKAGQDCRKRNQDKFPKKRKARRAINNAVRDGRFPHVSTQLCNVCGQQAQEYHHHNGYEKDNWFDVIPLCRSCHIKLEEETAQ